MIFTVPSLPALLAMSAVPPLIGFALAHHYGDAAAWLTAFVVDVSSLYAIVMHLQYWYVEYLRDEAASAPKPVPLKVNDMVYSQTVDAVQINREQQVAHVLLEQKAEGLRVDLTESFWLKRGNFPGTRAEWVDVMDRWGRDGAIARRGFGRSSPYEVKNWSKVRAYSRGVIPQ